MANLIDTLASVLQSSDPVLPNETKRILLKEATQGLVLDFIYNHRIYRGLNFYGGTCLHVIFDLNRLSEDIDLDNSGGVGLDSLADDLLAYTRTSLMYPAAELSQRESEGGILRYTLRFPVLHELGLSDHVDERLHLKVEISQHTQVAVIERTPVFFYGRSFVPAHFSLETMMAGKMLACLERSFEVGDSGVLIKGRDYYDLLWFMQRHAQPLVEKLEKDGTQAYNVRSAMMALSERVRSIRPQDLSLDLLPLFENRTYIENWISAFHENFERLVGEYI